MVSMSSVRLQNVVTSKMAADKGKIQYKVGDLIAAAKAGDVAVIAHGCNCFNTMGSGIAPKIAEAFPEAWQADQETDRGNREKLGKLSLAFSTGGVLVCNLYSQYTFTGRKKGEMDLDYWALRSSLAGMASVLYTHCKVFNIEPHDLRIGLPKIGAGLAGGDWSIISKIIQGRLRDFDVTIYVLKESDLVQQV